MFWFLERLVFDKCFLYYLIWFIDLDRFVLIVNRVKDVWVIVYVYISVLV